MFSQTGKSASSKAVEMAEGLGLAKVGRVCASSMVSVADSAEALTQRSEDELKGLVLFLLAPKGDKLQQRPIRAENDEDG